MRVQSISKQENCISGIFRWMICVLVSLILVPACTKKKNITFAGYMFSVVAKARKSEWPMVQLLAPGGGRRLIGGSEGEDSVVRTLYITPSNKKTSDELLARVKAIEGVQQVTLVPISDPVRASELEEIRKLYLDFKQDLSAISDDQLKLFINTQLKGEYTYCLVADPVMPDQNGLLPVRFRTVAEILEEHKNDPPGKIISETKRIENGEEIHEVTMEMSVEDTIGTPPPPPSFRRKD